MQGLKEPRDALGQLMSHSKAIAELAQANKENSVHVKKLTALRSENTALSKKMRMLQTRSTSLEAPAAAPMPPQTLGYDDDASHQQPEVAELATEVVPPAVAASPVAAARKNKHRRRGRGGRGQGGRGRGGGTGV